MQILLNPKSLFLINTLPVILIFVLFTGQFEIINSLLKPENISIWISFAVALGSIAIGILSYAVYCTIYKKQISIYYGIITLLTNIVFLYLYSFYSSDIFPNDIPLWMMPSDVIFYAGTFLMPTLVHCLLILVIRFTEKSKDQNPAVSFLMAFAIPLTCYLFSQIILPLFRKVEDNFGIHSIIVTVIISTILFLFFLIRAIYLLAMKKSGVWKRDALFWKIPLYLIFPIAGLLINNGHIWNSFTHSDNGIFGNFTSPWFYILTIIGGTLLCLPKYGNPRIQLSLFTAKSILFSFSLYFFIVFLPFLPVSIIAVLAIGFGFLMLCPLLIFVTYIKELADDFLLLRTVYKSKLLIAILAGGFMVIPIIITLSNLHHKAVLNEALDYVYNPDYAKEYSIDAESISKTLEVITSQKDRNSSVIFTKQMPYLTTYFNWLVLENMTLSDKKTNTLQTIFMGENLIQNPRSRFARQGNDEVKISNFTTKSNYNLADDTWKTEINFEIKNHSSDNLQKLFSTTFELPAGCWISDYYLYVRNKKETGLLVEKKAANWVFSQIVDTNQDPGILSYNNENNIEFKVSPFTKNQTRKTGITIIHKDPTSIIIDGNEVLLGKQNQQSISSKNNGNTVYISASEKQKLPEIQRSPYYFFIVDASINGDMKDAQNRIRNFSKRNNIDQNAKICFANTYSKVIDFNSEWLNSQPLTETQGGFYLDRAIKTELFKNFNSKEKKYPVFIVADENLINAIFPENMSDFQFTFPENNLFYTIDSAGNLNTNSLISPENKITDKPFTASYKVLAYPNSQHPTAFLPNDGKASVIITKPVFDVSAQNSDWENGLQLQANWQTQALFPAKAKENWISAIQLSFISKIMTPQTSYIVVENEAQKAMLIKKQNEILSGNKALDFDEDTQRMSEPALWLLALILALAYAYKKRNLIQQNLK